MIQEKEIQTNKLSVGINTEEFNKMFDTIKIFVPRERERSRDEKNELAVSRISLMKLKGIQSTVYEYGGSCWLFFNKGEAPDIEDLRDKFDKFSIAKVNFSQWDDNENVSDPNDIIWNTKRVLFKALLFSCASTMDVIGGKCSNVNGCLIYTNCRWVKKYPNIQNKLKTIYGLKIDINEQGNLTTGVVTFVNDCKYAASSTKFKKFKITNNYITAITKEELSQNKKTEEIYYIGTIGNKKNNVDFMDLSNYDKDQQWKIYYDIFGKLEENYKDLFTGGKITFVKKCMNFLEINQTQLLQTHLEDIRKGCRFLVYTDTSDEKLRNFQIVLKDILSKLNYSVVDELKDANAVIHIIHERKYYSGKRLTDEHGKKFGLPKNCITYEEFSNPNGKIDTTELIDNEQMKEGNALLVIIENVFVKNELFNGKIIGSCETYPMPMKVLTSKWINGANDKKELVYPYVDFIRTADDELIEKGTEVYNNSDLSGNNKNCDLRNIFCGNPQNEYLLKILENGKDFNVVIRNDNESTMPNLENVEAEFIALNSSLPSEKIERVKDLIQSLESEDEKKDAFFSFLKTELSNFNRKGLVFGKFIGAKIGEYNKLQDIKDNRVNCRSIKTCIEKHLEKNGFQIKLVSGFRSEKDEERNCLITSCCSGVKYFTDEFVYNGKKYPCIKYSIGGLSAPNKRIAKRTLIRTLYLVNEYGMPKNELLPDKLFFQIIESMQVDNIRIGQLSVVPSHCKYLREHVAMEFEETPSNLWHDLKDNPDSRIMFIDTETDGLPTMENGYKIWPKTLQIAWEITDPNSKIIKKENHFIRTVITNLESQKIHQINQQKLNAEGEELADVLRLLNQHLEECHLLVAHNVDFDINVLRTEFSRCDIESTLSRIDTFCTCRNGGRFYNSQSSSIKLETLYEKLTDKEISRNAHDAFIDVELARDCFFGLMERNVPIVKKNLEPTCLLIRELPGISFEEQLKAMTNYCFSKGLNVIHVGTNNSLLGEHKKKEGIISCIEKYQNKKVSSITFVEDENIKSYFEREKIKYNMIKTD